MVEADSKSVVCEVRGELDQATATTLRGSVPFLVHAPKAVIDLSGVMFIDAVGLCALIGTLRAVRESGTPPTLIVTRPALRAVLEASGVEALAPIVCSLADALGHIRPASVT
jgi:anti-sigma B factor antagonist